jgi:putative oxidoreductase
MYNSLILLLGRMMLAAVFIPAGLKKFGDIAGTSGYITSVGLPAGTYLAYGAAAFEVVCGIAVLVGFQTKWAALALAGFCILTGVLFHSNGDMMNTIMLFKNIGLAGGFLILSASNAGCYSIDSKLKKS